MYANSSSNLIDERGVCDVTKHWPEKRKQDLKISKNDNKMRRWLTVALAASVLDNFTD